MPQCEPMTSYHYSGTGIEGANVPEWVSGYPSNEVDPGALDGGAKRRKTQRKGRKTQRISRNRRVNSVRRNSVKRSKKVKGRRSRRVKRGGTSWIDYGKEKVMSNLKDYRNRGKYAVNLGVAKKNKYLFEKNLNDLKECCKKIEKLQPNDNTKPSWCDELSTPEQYSKVTIINEGVKESISDLKQRIVDMQKVEKQRFSDVKQGFNQSTSQTPAAIPAETPSVTPNETPVDTPAEVQGNVGGGPRNVKNKKKTKGIGKATKKIKKSEPRVGIVSRWKMDAEIDNATKKSEPKDGIVSRWKMDTTLF